MQYIGGFGSSALTFILVLSVLVFVHELGHYLVARWNKVRIEVFSIGFGPEVFGFHDRTGTRWKFSILPLGGYVRMFGDAEAASSPDSQALATMSEADKAVSYHHKPVGQRAAVAAAGPAANFLFALLVLSGLYMIAGQSFTPADVGTVQPGSAAERAGLLPGDVIVAIDGTDIERFEEVRQVVSMNAGRPLAMVIMRSGRQIPLTATPDTTEFKDRFGNIHRIGLLGIGRAGTEMRQLGPFTAVWQASREITGVVTGTLTALGQMVEGSRSTEELGGPLRIAQVSSEVAQSGTYALVWFLAFLSVNLGLLNLFPIPVLDGGHLLFYAFEAARGKPLGPRAQEYGFRIGLALVLTLMVFATWNDLVQLHVVEFFRGLMS
jgi:regulator of sigma E protease